MKKLFLFLILGLIIIAPAFSQGETEVMESGRINYITTDFESVISFVADIEKGTIGIIVAEEFGDPLVPSFYGDKAKVTIGIDTLDVEYHKEVWFASTGAYIGDLNKFFKMLKSSEMLTIGSEEKNFSVELYDKDSFVLALMERL